MTTATQTGFDVEVRFAELIERHRGIVVKVAATYCRDPADREDVAQEILRQPWRATSSTTRRGLSPHGRTESPSMSQSHASARTAPMCGTPPEGRMIANVMLLTDRDYFYG